ncbi:MAG: hypothetical protein M1823_004700 [Watsoniomyces obsoletus]|nr:MAG: hypothetical protein M1823_004700 [Watsoniomyces obsoletus]
MAPTDVSRFATTQIALLDAELQAELAEATSLVAQSSPTTLQRAGLAITNLVLSSQRTGLGGKTVIDLEPDSAIGGDLIQEHGIRTADIVSIQEQVAGSAKKKERDEASKVTGVVTRVRGPRLSIAVNEGEEEVSPKRLWVLKMTNDATYKRMSQAMSKLGSLPKSEYTPLMQTMFGHSSPASVDMGTHSELNFFDPTLNESQKDAIRFALASGEVALIHGPPGTGKTYTLVELIRQLLSKGQRLLVCGPSNISVDNIVERLAVHRVSMIRLGHPARLLPSVVDHSLDVLLYGSDAAEIVRDIRTEMDQKQASIKKTRNGKERRAIYGELRELRKEYREREKKCLSTLISGTPVILSTLHGAGGHQLRDQRFDTVIIDEASQALEAQCWVPLVSATKVVLAGDHLQLPPTIKSLNSTKTLSKSKDGKSEGLKGVTLETTLFDRLLALYGAKVKRMLTTQYRMHEKIMRFPSDELYDGRLIAAEAVKSRLLRGLPYGVKETEDTLEPLVFWDTQGGDFPERSDHDEVGNKAARAISLSESKSNEMEAALVQLHMNKLVQAGVRVEDIAIVTPYNAQLTLLARNLKGLYPALELGSVDGFQGREKEAIILSLVRSNPEHEVGFLGEKRRLNVAMTRPKRHLCVIGDSETVGRGSAFLKRWMAFLEEHADLRYPNAADLLSSE